MTIDTIQAPVGRRTSVRPVAVPTLLVAVMVATGFAMLAIIPLTFAVRGVVRGHALRDVRPWVALLAASYATPLLLWAAVPGRERSLSRDMHPGFVPVIVAAALAVLVAAAVVRRRPGTDPTTNEES